MATRDPLTIGPFGRGLNTFDDPTAIRDDELAEAMNFDIGLEGSLKSRPPFTDTGDDLPLGATGQARLLGYFYDSDGDPYLIASDGLSSTYSYDGSSWMLITNTFAATDMCQFDGLAWLVSPNGEADPGGSWTPSGGFIADNDMPHGESIESYKQRLWIAEGRSGTHPTRVRYSKVLGQPDFWDSPSLVDIGSGDGEAIVKIIVYFDVLLVFRAKSIWSFQYGVDPATAITGVIVPGVGLMNRFSLVEHENFLYFMYDDKAYEFINNKANQINIKTPFLAQTASAAAWRSTVSVFNYRILFAFFDITYVFNLRTRTWTRWQSTEWSAIGQVMPSFVNGEADKAYALSARLVPAAPPTRVAKLLRIEEEINAFGENFTCLLITKNYSFNLPGTFKVMFWWGADVIFRTNIKGVATPIVFNLSFTWGDFLLKTWGTLATWRHPVAVDLEVPTSYTILSGPLRKFARFLKKMRFRQINFRLEFDLDGSISTAPVQVFTLSAYMAEKQTVSKDLS